MPDSSKRGDESPALFGKWADEKLDAEVSKAAHSESCWFRTSDLLRDSSRDFKYTVSGV